MHQVRAQRAHHNAVTGLAAPVGILAEGAAGLAFVALVDPNEPGHYPTCPFLATTGLWCPGCGTLRAMHALSHGDVGAAVGLNVLAVASIPLLAVIWWRWAARSRSGASRARAASPAWLWALLALVVAFGVVRNLPFGAALAP